MVRTWINLAGVNMDKITIVSDDAKIKDLKSLKLSSEKAPFTLFINKMQWTEYKAYFLKNFTRPTIHDVLPNGTLLALEVY